MTSTTTPPAALSLLLISSPPSPPTRPALQAAYREPLQAAISGLQPSSSLIVALAAPFLPLRWTYLQSLLAGLYSLVASIQSTSAPPSGADVTVLLVDHVRGRAYPPDRPPPNSDTTVADLGTFASVAQRWTTIFHSSTEQGYELLSAFLQVAERSQTLRQQQLVALPGGLSLTSQDEDTAPTPTLPSERLHRSLILAGTFDHFHVGHKLLLHASALLLSLPRNPPVDSSQQAIYTVGMSSDALLKNKKFAAELEPWSTRARSVLNFLSLLLSSPLSPDQYQWIGDDEEVRAVLCDGRVLVRCVSIVDVYGPTITDEEIEALILSGETRAGGAAVNKKRSEQGWKELAVYEIDVISAYKDGEEGEGDAVPAPDDFSAKISSTEARRRQAEARKQLGDGLTV